MSKFPITEIASPNRDDRPEDAVISTLVLHYTGMKSCQEAIDRLCDRNAKVSAHYVVDEDGHVYHLVDESDRAWHAGKSAWRGRERVNDFSIGIEIVNPGHEFGYRPFPEKQMESVLNLSKIIIARYGISKRNVIGHSDIAPDRKEDPGELFDWEYLAKNGVGLWPCDQLSVGGSQLTAGSIKSRLMKYGYPDAEESKLITAFQRHFRQRDIGGVWDDECEAILRWLESKIR